MLSINNICKKYNNFYLNNVSLNVSPGKLVCITGKENSGKTILLSIIASIIKQDKGTITLEKNETISFVPSKDPLFEMLTVRDNLKFWGSVYKKDYTKITFVNNLLNEKVKFLSNTLKRKVSIAIALISEPTYIIIDEPENNLCIYDQKEISNIIYYLKVKGHGIVLVSSLSTDLYKSDYLYVIDKGQIIYKNDPKTLAYSLEEFDKLLYETIKVKGNINKINLIK